MELLRSPSLRIGIRLQNHMHTAVADRASGRGEGGADGAGHLGLTGSRLNECDLRDEQLDLYGGLDAKESMMMAELNCTGTGNDATGSYAVGVARKDIELTRDEKQYLMSVERGDVPTARKWLQEAQIHYGINVNCVDALGRTALVIAIENDNVEMIELLLTFKVDVGDALLHAINEGNVEATLMLLHVTDTQRRETNASPLDCPANKEKAAKITAKWKRLTRNDKSVDAEDVSAADTVTDKLLLEASSLRCSSSFTPDITPLILAAHRDHYEIIKILLERGDRIKKPHDVQCGCAQCVVQSSEDSLNHSRSRINAYRALASPSLIALSSRDPILTAFKLSWELRLLSRLENELKVEYEQLAKQCQDFAVDLLDQTRGSKELEVLLNYDSDGLVSDSMDSSVVKDGMSLARLKLAIKYKQKKFVSHASCQQLLASLWYEGLLGFRRRHILFKILLTVSVFVLYPVLSCIYMIAPKSSIGRFMRRPFIKFICHSASYLTFLFLLILASQRIESITNLALSGHNEAKMTREVRGAPPTSIEWMILAYVAGLVWAEVKQLWDQGVKSYIYDMWNILDFTTNSLYIATYTLKLVAYLRVEEEKRLGKATANMPREQWDAYDPTLISEGLFAAANIFSSLKLIYLFTVNPHLGPLQISLGRMVIDILKFLFIALLVCFSYSCGVNQLYWYYAEERIKVCNDCIKTRDAIECKCDRTLANLFEIVQTLYFAIYGLVDIHHFELKEKHEFTQFVGKLMYGTYCGIMIIVLINMLIAMLSSSFQTISNDADTEWKFARSKLWMSYFDEGGTVPAPFNIIPTPKTFYYILLCIKHNMCNCTKKAKHDKWESIRKAIKRMREREEVYQGVIRDLVKRYVMKRQRVTNADGVTEDDINEIKQDISSFRYELLEILKCNDMKVPKLTAAPSHSTGNARQRRRNNRKMYSMDSRSSTETPTEQSFDKFRAQQSLDDDVTILPFSKDRNSSENGSQQTPDSSGLFRPSFDSKNEKCRWKRTLERIDSKPDKCVESGYSPPTFFLVKSVSGGDTSVFADGTESEFGFSGSSSQLLFNSERKVKFQIRDENVVDNESTEPASGSIDSNDDSQALPVTSKSSKLWRMKFKHNKK